MIAPVLLIAALPWLATTEQERPEGPSCAICHGEADLAFRKSVHRHAGLDCVTCHGGDPTLVTREACVDNPTFKGIPSGAELTESCGGCHADIDLMRQYSIPTEQLRLFKTSAHGKLLYEKGSDDAPTCATCHGAHDVLRVTDHLSPVFRSNVPETCAQCHSDAEKMARYDLPADIFDKYARSVHGVDLISGETLGLPHCGDCHGTHGAKPAGVKEVANVCGHCHVATQDYFEQSAHFLAAQRGSMEECTVCHGEHAITPLTLVDLDGSETARSVCSECHDSEDPNDPGWKVALATAKLLEGFRGSIEAVETRVEEARSFGLLIDDEEGYLKEAHHALIMTGPISHTNSVSDIRDLVNKGEGVLARIDESIAVKLRHVRDRRIYATILFGGVLFVIVLLAIKRRRLIESSNRAASTERT